MTPINQNTAKSYIGLLKEGVASNVGTTVQLASTGDLTPEQDRGIAKLIADKIREVAEKIAPTAATGIKGEPASQGKAAKANQAAKNAIYVLEDNFDAVSTNGHITDASLQAAANKPGVSPAIKDACNLLRHDIALFDFVANAGSSPHHREGGTIEMGDLWAAERTLSGHGRPREGGPAHSDENGPHNLEPRNDSIDPESLADPSDGDLSGDKVARGMKPEDIKGVTGATPEDIIKEDIAKAKAAELAQAVQDAVQNGQRPPGGHASVPDGAAQRD